MADSLNEQKAALERWLSDPAVQADLERHDWSAAFKTYPRLNLEDEPIPWAGPLRDLRGARITLVGSAGLSAPGQPLFNAGDIYGDYTWRVLPSDIDLATTTVAHEHYNHVAADQDRNSVYPLDRLRDLVNEGFIGGLTANVFSMMGYLPLWPRTMYEFAPAFAELVAGEHPDAVLMVPV